MAIQQAQPTFQTKLKAKRIMDYVATYLNTYIRYHASNMILTIDSDAAYLVAPKARSCVAGYLHMNNTVNTEPEILGSR